MNNRLVNLSSDVNIIDKKDNVSGILSKTQIMHCVISLFFSVTYLELAYLYKTLKV